MKFIHHFGHYTRVHLFAEDSPCNAAIMVRTWCTAALVAASRQHAYCSNQAAIQPNLTPALSQVLACDIDLLNPSPELEKRKHKLKRLVQSPNSYFMDVKCQGCFNMCVGDADDV